MTAAGRRLHARLPVPHPCAAPDGWALAVIALAVLIANALVLIGYADTNPLGPRGDLVSAFTLGHTAGQPTIDPNVGFVSQALGHLATLDVFGLHLPWWNPYEGTGSPLLGETQSAALFPPTWLTALAHGQVLEHTLLEFLAGAATYALLRRVGLVRMAAMAGGVAFALDGTFAWFAHATVNPVAFLPLLLLGIEQAAAAAAEGRRGGWWLMAIAGALSVYAGFPEVAYIDTLMGVAWFIWRCTRLPRPALRAFAGKAMLATLAGVLLAAPMLVAILDYYPHADLGAHGSTLFGAGRFGAKGLPQLLLPYVYGPIFAYNDPHGTLLGLWETLGGFLTTSLVAFGLVGVTSRRHRALVVTLIVWGLLVFARMFGIPPLLDHVIGVFPGMSSVAFFRYATAALELSVIVLAAVGLDRLAREPGRRVPAVAALIALLLVVAAAVGARPLAGALGAKFANRPYYAGAVGWGVLVVAAALAVITLARPRVRVALAAVLIGIDVLALFAVPELAAPRNQTLDLAPVAYLRQHLGLQRFYTLGPIQPNYGSYFRLAELNANDVPVPAPYASYVHRRLDPWVDPTLFVGNGGGGRSPLVPTPAQQLVHYLDGYREAGVAYVLAPPGQALASHDLTLVARTPTTWIYRLTGTQAYFTASGCAVRASGRETVVVSCRTPSRLVRRETVARGWSASVDGRAASIGTVEGVFQSVAVPAGTHTVRFGFVPADMGWAALAGLAGVLVLGGGVLSGRRTRGAARGPRPS